MSTFVDTLFVTYTFRRKNVPDNFFLIFPYLFNVCSIILNIKCSFNRTTLPILIVLPDDANDVLLVRKVYLLFYSIAVLNAFTVAVIFAHKTYIFAFKTISFEEECS